MVAFCVIIGREGRDQAVLGEVTGPLPVTFMLRLKYKCLESLVKCDLHIPPTRRSYPEKIALASKSSQFVGSAEEAPSISPTKMERKERFFDRPDSTLPPSDDRK
jgi:hypothetical protein